jgi:hypothetical protein
MGTLPGDNGGGRPPDGDGLPDLPPEWGTIIIPDDPSELAREASTVRRELRRFTRRNRWRRRFHLTPISESVSRDTPTLGLPILIMAIAIVATMTSLFALAWPGQVARPMPSPPARASVAATTVPDVALVNPAGGAVHVRNSLPAVLLLEDGCACGDLDLATAQAVPAGVTVLAVGRIAPPVLPSSALVGLRLLAVADSEGRLRSTFAKEPTETGVLAVLVRRTGEVIRTVHAVTKVDDFQADLTKLS